MNSKWNEVVPFLGTIVNYLSFDWRHDELCIMNYCNFHRDGTFKGWYVVHDDD